MKFLKSSMLLVTTLTSLSLLAGSALAQEKKTDEKKPETETKAPRGAGARGDRLEAMTTQLNLTAEQKEKLKPILKEQEDALKTVREDQNMPREEKMKKFRESQESVNEKIKPILTAEQLEKWNKQREEMAKRFGKKKE